MESSRAETQREFTKYRKGDGSLITVREAGFSIGRSGNIDMMGFAIDDGIDMSQYGYSGALSADNAEMIDYLRKRGVKVGYGVQFTLTNITRLNIKTVVALAEADVDGVCDFHLPPFLLHNDKLPLEERVRLLIRKKYVQFAYDLAVKTGNVPVIRTLIAAGVPFNHKADINMFRKAHKDGHKDALMELLRVNPVIVREVLELKDMMKFYCANWCKDYTERIPQKIDIRIVKYTHRVAHLRDIHPQ